MHRTRPAALARSAWRRWFLDRSAEFWLGELRATWSLRELRARVVAVRAETRDTKTFTLTTPRAWPGHLAGQYVPVEVEIEGVRVRRCYSISSGGSAPGRQRIEITVKCVPGGRVSTWMHEHLAVGAVVRLGPPAGDFTVAAPAKLLLVGAGSGITPIAAIVRDLVARGAARDVIVIEAARSDADAIFADDLAALADERGLQIIAHRGPLTAETIRAHAPDLAAREVYVCGPAPVMDLLEHLAGPRVHLERFAPAARARTPVATRARVHLAVANRTVEIAGGTLLEGLERAGERPAHGCRMGICNTCRCTKRSGTVEDLVTGAISSEPDQEIRLCVSAAHSDLELSL
jgi:ferredoxin-NADP reductase